MLAFRARYYVGVLTYLFNVAVYYFIWRAVFRTGTTVSGLTLPDMITYVAVGWAIRSFYFNEIDRDLGDPGAGRQARDEPDPAGRLPDGHDRGRGRPVGLPGGPLHGADLHRARPALPAQAPGLGRRRPACSSFSATMSFFLVAAINFLVGLIAIRSKSILGILRAKYLRPRAALGPAHPDDVLPGAAADDPLRLALPAHQLHAGRALPRQGDGRRGGEAARRSRPGGRSRCWRSGQWAWQRSQQRITIQGG